MKGSVNIKDRATGTDTEAELFDTVSLDDFIEAQDKWRPITWRVAALRQLAGEPPLGFTRWDWSTKKDALGRLDVTFYGIRCAGQLQGLMKADTGGLRRCRLDSQKGQELVYVDYVETAPWNIPEYMGALGRKAIYASVGARLMQAAVQLSIESELKGRLGLHSLPAAEAFYRRIGMTALERDPLKQNLLWFEFTAEAAQNFMETYL